jgi:hypothetical protein
MAQIIHFRTPHDDVVELLETILQQTKNGEIEGFVIAAQMKNGEIASGWAGLDIGARQNLVSHLQIDLMYHVVKVNMDQLLGF